ncbi:gamma-glutamyltransferase [Aureimonas populi]|uniref:Glutathione hydrolase proenzyme n=1 Tax=Aureimonas populi TaxID=1701758 RepID=A0ABW5CIT4_9HYPH
MMRSMLGALAAISLATSVALAQEIERPAPEAATGFAERQAVSSVKDMVVAAHPLAAEAGARMLAAGGTAIDAMIATQLVLNLVEPQSSGIGGGAFLLYRDARTGRMTAYDGRETAPAAAMPDLFLDDLGQPLSFMDAVVGGRSVGTPGTLRLMELTHRLHGRLAWAELFEPAIRLAEEGFEVGERLAGLVAGDEALTRQEAARDYFHPEGRPIEAGDTLRNPEFAATLRAIAERGAEAFYQGEIAEDIVQAVQGFTDNPGTLALEDLAHYRVVPREPVCAPFRVYEVCGMGPPSSGGLTVGQILGLLDHFDLEALEPLSPAATHLFVEASRLAYADRALYIADSDFVRVPAKGLLDPGYTTARAQRIDRAQAAEAVSAGNPPWREAGLRAPDRSLEIPSTSHVSIMDGEGNVVSLTTTIEAGFGSRLMVRGFLLNNELTDFSFVPEEGGLMVANRVEGGKRPRSSMAPTIVLDAGGEPVLVVGSPGGARIIPYVARTILGVLVWGLDPQEAVSLPHVATLGGPVDLEEGLAPEGLAQALEALGHEVRMMELNSGLHAISLERGRLSAGVDPRREGAARSSGEVEAAAQ